MHNLNYRRHWNFIQYIEDLDRFSDTQQCILVTVDEEVESTLVDLGYDPQDYGGLFVLAEDGEFLGVWGFEGSVPYLRDTIDRLF